MNQVIFGENEGKPTATTWRKNSKDASIYYVYIVVAGGHGIVGSSSDSRARGCRFDTRPHTFVSPSSDSRRTVVSYWQKCMQEVLVDRLGDLSLPRKSVVRLTDRSDMTIDVYHGCKTTT